MMKRVSTDSATLIFRLRRFLPLTVHGRPGLVGRLKKERPEVNGASRLYITNIYDAGETGLMCAIKLDPDSGAAPVLVASIDEIAIDRRHPITREVALYQRGAAKRH
jgi:hypothetical protein